MAMPSAPRQKRTQRLEDDLTPTSTTMGSMQEPISSLDRPITDSDPVTENRTGRIGDDTVTPRTDRGFTTTFAVAAVVLLIAFMIALYLGTRGSDDVANTNSTTPQTPVTESAPTTPGNGDQSNTPSTTTGSNSTTPPASDSTSTTGSTTPAPDTTAPATPPSTAPATGSGTNSGSSTTGGTTTTP
jgi:cytoskeletal protein RodZ